MQSLRQAASGLLLAVASAIIVLGGFLLAFTEAGMLAPAPEIPTQVATIPQVIPSPSVLTTPTLLNPTGIPSPSATVTVIPPASCPPPSGWLLYTIYPGDTLEGLAQRFQTNPETLRSANCLYAESLIPGYVLYVPPAPSPTPCRPPTGWVKYIVQPGDNLYRIGLSYGISAAELQRANCLPSADRIIAGSTIYVPNIPTLTPIFTPTPVLPPTEPATFTPAVPTETPLTIIFLPSPSASPTLTATLSATPSPTSTQAPDSTATP